MAGEIGMLDATSNGRLEVGFARAFLPHEFERFGVPLNESRARFTEGVALIGRLLEEEKVSAEGRFWRFREVTSLPRPTQKPRPPFWVAAFATPQSFEEAARAGHNIMGIPRSGRQMAELIALYRATWRAAGHPGEGKVMLSFLMYCAPTTKEAIAIAEPQAQGHVEAMLESAATRAEGTSSADYPGYDKMFAQLKTQSFEDQRAKGAV